MIKENLKSNLPIIIFDLTIIIFRALDLFLAEETFNRIMEKPGYAVFSYTVAFLFLPLLLSVLIARFQHYYGNVWITLIKWFFWIYYIVIAAILFYDVFQLLDKLTPSESNNFFIGISLPFIGVFIIIGLICARYMREREETLLKGEQPFGYELQAVAIVIIVTLFVYLIFIFAPYLKPLFPFESPAMNVLLGSIEIIGLIVIIVVVAYRYEPFFEQKNNLRFFRMIRNLILPVIISFIFFFLHRMEMHIVHVDSYSNFHGVIRSVIIGLVSGIIPFRIIMMFNPPFSPVNAGTGILSLLFMFGWV